MIYLSLKNKMSHQIFIFFGHTVVVSNAKLALDFNNSVCGGIGKCLNIINHHQTCRQLSFFILANIYLRLFGLFICFWDSQPRDDDIYSYKLTSSTQFALVCSLVTGTRERTRKIVEVWLLFGLLISSLLLGCTITSHSTIPRPLAS